MEQKKTNPVFEFFLTTLNGMAYGLFATLIIGTIISAMGTLFSYGENNFCQAVFGILGNGTSAKGGISFVLQVLTGAGIGVGVALALKFTPLQTIVLAGVGEISAYLSLTTSFVTTHVVNNAMKIGDPLTIYLVVISAAILIKLIFCKKTPVDILIIPLFGIIAGTVFSMLIRYPIIYVTYGIQWFINMATTAQPFIMGIVVSVLMGMALTAPISSAAIAAIIFMVPNSIPLVEAAQMSEYQGLFLASGAAVIGCSTQMVGFAIQSRKDNSIGMVLSLGIGTSMLQFKNILRKPVIWLPTIIASAILGPISTCLLKIYCIGSSAGMGTSGLVGQIGTFQTMGFSFYSLICVLVFEIIAPIVLVFFIDLLFRKLKLIKDGDLKV